MYRATVFLSFFFFFLAKKNPSPYVFSEVNNNNGCVYQYIYIYIYASYHIIYGRPLCDCTFKSYTIYVSSAMAAPEIFFFFCWLSKYTRSIYFIITHFIHNSLFFSHIVHILYITYRTVRHPFTANCS